MKTNIIAWGLYALFVIAALYFNAHPTLFSFDTPLGGLKALVWILWLGFLAYSIHCSLRENFMRAAMKIIQFYWGRQISADLYLGVFLAMTIIYLHEGAVVALLWALPAIVFANLAILPYFAIHFDSLVAHFLG